MILLFPQGIIAQEYLFDIQHISVKDGLPERSVDYIQQDKDGFVWGSSLNGFFRYDGYEFDVYRNVELGLPISKHITFFPDDEGLIWYRETTENISPVYLLNPTSKTWQTLADFYKAQLPANFNNQIIRLHKDPILGIVFITKNGQFFSCKGGKITLIYQHYTKLVQATPDEYTYASFLVAETEDNYWFYHQDTVFHILANKTIEHFVAAHPLTDIFKQKDGLHLIYGPVFSQYKRNRKHFAKLENGIIVPYQLPSVEPTAENCRYPILEDNEGFKWHKKLNNTDKTVVCLTPKNEVIFDQSFFVEDKEARITSIYVDNQNNCWVATDAGIYKITRRKIPFKTYLNGYSTRGIYKQNNTLMVNTWAANSNPIRANIDLKTNETVFESLPIINYAFHQSDKDLWIGSNENVLYRKNLKTGKTDAFKSDIPLSFILPFQFKNSQQIWIGTKSGLVCFDTKIQIFKKFESSSEALNKAYVYHIRMTEEGIWIATSHGLFLMDEAGNIIQTLDKKNGLPTAQVNYSYQDKVGIFWLATKDKGLLRWDRKTDKKTFIGRKQGFLNENIYAVFEDDYGFLWLPSDYGLIRFNKETFEVNTYLPEQGLLHEEFNSYSYHQDEAGNLYFGGLGGVISFHPKDITGNTNTEVPLHFKSFKVLKNNETEIRDISEEVRTQQALTIQPNDKLFEVYFTLLDFKKKDKFYSYKIEGYDQNWNYSTDNFIRINTLPYGSYQLKLKGQIDGITWTAKPLVMAIEVLRPFYLKTWFILLAIASIGLGFWLYTRYRTQKLEQDKRKLEQTVKERTVRIEAAKTVIESQAEALKELDIAKTHFFSNMTHEFRTPLTLIIGPIQQIAAEVSSSSLRKRLHNVGKNAQELLNLINQLLDLSKLESGQMKVEILHGDIIDYTRNLVNQLQPLADRKKQSLSFSTNKTIWKTNFDEKKWQKIIFNLLSNAIKFTPDGGTIQFSLMQQTIAEKDTIYFSIQDNGIGVTAEGIENIFNRFYQVDSSTVRLQEGTGIGLSLVKELVELQGGTIGVNSEMGKGTTFEVQLPVLKEMNMPIAVLSPIIEEALVLPDTTVVEDETKIKSSDTEKLDLLIIEDNAEIREYIGFCLDASKYNIIEAADGEEGIEKALALIPDLIISDVMMPKKDGFEVLETIRKEVSTSHIPLILLTAKTALDSRLKGFESGADAYLTKPFSPKELALRIHKLIEVRQALQQRYQGGHLSVNESNEIFAREDQFIIELKTYVETHMDEAVLQGDVIAQHFSLSRSSLYRKLKALTNQSVTEFIRTQRLAKAAELLRASELTVSEITYATGFSSPSHFARAFKKQYGKAPSELR